MCVCGELPFVLENPVGRLSTYWCKPDVIVHPYYFAEYGTPGTDAYTKKTCLWIRNGAYAPRRVPFVGELDLHRMHHSSKLVPWGKRGEIGSITPPGFARALWLANDDELL